MTEVATITIGAVNYSVYGVTSDALSDANNYFAASLGAAEWTAASTTTKQQALVTAFRAIERELWSGTKLDPAQTTEWGRTGATKNGVVVDDGIPLDIVYGQFEMALYFLKDASNVSKPNTASNVKSVKAGSAQVNFFYPLPGSTLRWPSTGPSERWRGLTFIGTLTPNSVSPRPFCWMCKTSTSAVCRHA